jgi:hypothetical protein
MPKTTITLPAPKPEMGVRGVTGCTVYFYDGGKQITQEEYNRQTLAAIAGALGATGVVFTKPSPTIARRRDAAGAAADQAAGAEDAEEEKDAETPKEERKTGGVPQHGLADFIDAAFTGGGKKKAGKKEKGKKGTGERFSLEDITGK